MANTYTKLNIHIVFHVKSTGIKKTVRYIQTQAKHHKEESVIDEYKRFLDVNGIEYDERHLIDK